MLIDLKWFSTVKYFIRGDFNLIFMEAIAIA